MVVVTQHFYGNRLIQRLFEVSQNDVSIGFASPKKMVKKKNLEGFKANQTVNGAFL